jgi:hypothetical protein
MLKKLVWHVIVEPFHFKWKILSSFVIFVFMLNEAVLTIVFPKEMFVLLGEMVMFLWEMFTFVFFFNEKSPKKRHDFL